MQPPLKNLDGTWLALFGLAGAVLAGTIVGEAATGRVTDARLRGMRGSFDVNTIPIRVGYGTYDVFQRWWWGQSDPLYALLSRRGSSVDWVVVEATPAEVERLIEVAHQILSDAGTDDDEKRTARATLGKLTEGMGQTNGAMGPGAVSLGSRSKRTDRIAKAIAGGALDSMGSEELASMQVALQSAGSLAKTGSFKEGDRVYNASREVGGIVVGVLGRVGGPQSGSIPEPALVAADKQFPFGTRLYEVLYDGLTYSHGDVLETDLVAENQGSAALDLDAIIARVSGQSRQQKGGETRYGMSLRPPGLGAVPKGFLRFGPHPDFRHGEIVYPQPLSEQDARHFSLIRILTTEELASVAIQIARQIKYPINTLQMVAQEGPIGFRWFAPGIGQQLEKRNIHVKDRDDFAMIVFEQLRAMPLEHTFEHLENYPTGTVLLSPPKKGRNKGKPVAVRKRSNGQWDLFYPSSKRDMEAIVAGNRRGVDENRPTTAVLFTDSKWTVYRS